MLYLYIGCLTFGAIFAVLSSILGGHGFDHGGGDIGAGGDIAGGVHLDAEGYAADGSHAHSGADGPSPFNPLVMASAIATFGGVGLIGKLGFGMGDAGSAVVALFFAGAVGAALFYGIVRFMYNSQSNTSFSLTELEGTEAEVITPLPEKGLGEIACVINGIRYTFPAKSENNEKIERGVVVKIRDVMGNTALVYPKVSIDDIDF